MRVLPPPAGGSRLAAVLRRALQARGSRPLAVGRLQGAGRGSRRARGPGPGSRRGRLSVAALKTQVFRELLTYMLSDPHKIEPSLDLILISRHLERIGDHATNIAEDVIFMVSARDVRHHAADSGEPVRASGARSPSAP